jgi:hypothetical protein
VDEVAASGILTVSLSPSGTGTITVTAATPGTAANNTIIRVYASSVNGSGAALTVSAPVSVSLSGSTYTVYALPGQATLENLRAALNSQAGIDAIIASGTGSSLLNLPFMTLADGQDLVNHSGSLTIASQTFTLTSSTQNPATQTVTVTSTRSASQDPVVSFSAGVFTIDVRTDGTTTVANVRGVCDCSSC